MSAAVNIPDELVEDVLVRRVGIETEGLEDEGADDVGGWTAREYGQRCRHESLERAALNLPWVSRKVTKA